MTSPISGSSRAAVEDVFHELAEVAPLGGRRERKPSARAARLRRPRAAPARPAGSTALQDDRGPALELAALALDEAERRERRPRDVGLGAISPQVTAWPAREAPPRAGEQRGGEVRDDRLRAARAARRRTSPTCASTRSRGPSPPRPRRPRCATTGDQPSYAAAIASTPEPQPQVGERAAGAARAAARGTCAWSRASRARRLPRDRSRRHGRPRRPAPSTGAGRAAVADEYGLVKALPAVDPVDRDLRRDDLERLLARPPAPEARGSRRERRTRRTRRRRRPRLLHAVGRQLEQLGQRRFRVLAPDADGEPDHARRARLSLANTPSSSAGCPRSASRRAPRAACAACGQPPRDDDVDHDPQVAAAAAAQGRQPRASDDRGLPRLVPGRELDRRRLVQRGHLDPRPQRRQGARTSIAVTRRSPSRRKRSSSSTCTRT